MEKEKLIVKIPRLLLGALFLFGAADGFSYLFTGSHLANMPTSDAGTAFEASLKATGFMWPLMKSIELVGGVCLLIRRAPAFGLAILAPIMTVSVLFHVVLNPKGLPVAIILVVLGGVLVRAYWKNYQPMFGGDGQTKS